MPSVTFVLATVVASVAMLLLQPVVGLDPAVLALVQLGPAIGAVATFLVHRRRLVAGRPDPVDARRFAAALGAALAASVVFAGVLTVLGLAAGQELAGAHGVGAVPFVVVLGAQLLGATAEEIGWRGVLQPQLETRWSVVAAAVVTGVVWGLWHIQYVAAGILIGAVFVFSTVVLSVLMAVVGRGTVLQRVVVASLVHWLVNISLLVALGDVVTLAAVLRWGVAAVVAAAVAVVLVRGVTRQARAAV
ncbi:CPBP family intramembrane glutamic endopeptidase [Isoptericola rhizosphaerae]|uniref:CPBP family intramembrane glutamic endopeptidase n=1 Tax=Isoptericola rhizosphaerae TaxID=3377837 RepID=UPI00383A42C6